MSAFALETREEFPQRSVLFSYKDRNIEFVTREQIQHIIQYPIS